MKTFQWRAEWMRGGATAPGIQPGVSEARGFFKKM